jgi:uncharacterized membrane protein YtjA (UPF0391 family)
LGAGSSARALGQESAGLIAAVREGSNRLNPNRENNMLSWSLTFFIVALIAMVLGFTGIAGAAAGIAQILFVIFLVLFLVSLIAGRRHT